MLESRRRKKTFEMSELRHRITVQSRTLINDGIGGKAGTWATLVEIWALIEPVKSFERLFANQVQYQRSHVCYLRYRDDLTTAMRISFDSRIFQIKGIRKVNEQKFFMILDLEEKQGS